MKLDDAVAVVTGATRGVGRGVARALAARGARVFITGRSTREPDVREAPITLIRCDHRDDREVDEAFGQILRDAGRVDILVNNVWGGYERMIEDGAFTWVKPFWSNRSGAGTPCSRPASGRTTGRVSLRYRP